MAVLRELLRDGKFTFAFTVMSILIILAILSFFRLHDMSIWNVVPRDMPPQLNIYLEPIERAGCLLGDDSCHQKFSYNGSDSRFFSRLIAIAMGLLAVLRAA